MKPAIECKNVVLIMSGKGGVGKSTMTRLVSEWIKDYTILVMDVDLTGPSTPLLFPSDTPSDNAIEADTEGRWVASKIRPNLYLMSLGLLLAGSTDDAVIWRGPRKTSVIEELLMRTVVPCDHLDIVLIDTPPGTSDEHIATIQTLKNQAVNTTALLITTPAEVSIGDVRRQCTFCS